MKEWAPFHIDALGLITLLGAEEVDRYYGQLCENPWVDWLPQLGSHVVAGLRFRSPMAGFQVFNVSDGIVTSEISPWLARWLLAQDFTQSISIIQWRSRTIEERRKSKIVTWIGMAIATTVNAVLLILPALQLDWWGLANGISMVLSVLVRQYLLRETKRELAKDIDKESRKDNLKQTTQRTSQVARRQQAGTCCSKAAGGISVSREEEEVGGDDEPPKVELFTILPSGQSVTLRVSRPLLKGSIIRNTVDKPNKTKWAKRLGWLSLGTLLVSIGQVALLTQIISVTTMILATIAAAHKVGCDDTVIASCLQAERDRQDERLLVQFFEEEQKNEDGSVRRTAMESGGRRMIAYARLQAAKNEQGEQVLLNWDLFPHKQGHLAYERWLTEYRSARHELETYYDGWKKRKTSSGR